METTNIKNEPEAHHDKNESFETPTNINNKRKSESLLESNNSNLETSQTSISPQSNASSSNLVTGREKRIRKIKAYDDDFLMYDMPSCSNSSLFQNLTKQMIPAQENTNEIKYNLGDLVWAKVSGHPWWPCMITNPELSATNSIKNYNEAKNENSHLRLIGGSRPKRSYYVEFFGPSIEHAWVPEGNIIEYKGIEEFKAYTQEQIDQANSKSAKDKLTEKFSLKITLPKRDGWDQAIVEADSFIIKKIRDRKIHFINKHIETGIIKKENSFELEEPKINNKNKRNSIDSNEESFQNETKKSPLSETNQEEVSSELVEENKHDYFIETTDIRTENPLKFIIKKKLIEDLDTSSLSSSQNFDQLSPKSDQISTKTESNIDEKTVFNLASKFDDENLEIPNSDSYLTDRYKNAAYHIRQGLSIDEVCNKYRISKSALIKYLERGTAPRGKKTRLTEIEEKELVEWLINYRELKYCDAINIVFDKVIDMFKDSMRKNPFPNGKPSVDWWYDFLSRHPQIMASKPDWIKRGKINDKYIQDVQSGNLKCTKFRRALLSAILYIRKTGDSNSTMTNLSQNFDENSQESFKINMNLNEITNKSFSSKTSEPKNNDEIESNDSLLTDYEHVDNSVNSTGPDDDINKLLDSLASDESEFIENSNEKKYEMKYLFVNNDDEDDYDYDLNR